MNSARMILITILAVLPVVTAVAGESAAPDVWTDYRGPTWDGHAGAAKLPLEWSEEKNVRWKTAIPGTGWSTPVIRDGVAWMTTALDDGRELRVVAVDLASGAIVHDREIFEVAKPAPKNALNSFASPTPAIDDERVYLHFGTDGTACLDTKTGETIWTRRDIHCDHEQGAGSSPVLEGDLLIFNMDGVDVRYVIALDKRTGETRWKTDRSADISERPATMQKAYSTPVFVDVDGQRRMISSAAGATYAYDPKTGKELWRVRHRGFSMSSRPIVYGDLVYINTAYVRPSLLAVRTGGKGDVTDDNIVWTCAKGVPTMSSPVLVDGRIYMPSESGTLTCIDAATGKTIWRRRIRGKHCASPIYANGRLYFFDTDGKTTVIAPGDEYEELAVNTLADGFMASPAVIGDSLILRTKTHLYCIEEPRAEVDSKTAEEVDRR